MGYKTVAANFREITSGFLTPVPPPRQFFEKNFFKIQFSKVTRNIKSATLITNIAITNPRNVLLKHKTVFILWDFWSPSLVFDPRLA